MYLKVRVTVRANPNPLFRPRLVYTQKGVWTWVHSSLLHQYIRNQGNLPRFAASRVYLAERLSWPWSQCQRYWQTPKWTSCRHNGTEMTFFQRCCCQWSAVWTCSRNSDRQRLGDTCRHSLLPMSSSAQPPNELYSLYVSALTKGFCYNKTINTKHTHTVQCSPRQQHLAYRTQLVIAERMDTLPLTSPPSIANNMFSKLSGVSQKHLTCQRNSWLAVHNKSLHSTS